jgi:isopenicillin N synthase-like dioxygenase
MTEFFKQPLEAKKVYSMEPGNLEGYGQHFVVSENQKLDWADMFYIMLRPSDSRNLRFWPSNPPSFRSACAWTHIHVQLCAMNLYYIYHFILICNHPSMVNT